MPISTIAIPNSERRGALSAPAAAEYLDTTVATPAKGYCHGEGPPYVKLGRKIVCRLEKLDAYLSELEVSPLETR